MDRGRAGRPPGMVLLRPWCNTGAGGSLQMLLRSAGKPNEGGSWGERSEVCENDCPTSKIFENPDLGCGLPDKWTGRGTHVPSREEKRVNPNPTIVCKTAYKPELGSWRGRPKKKGFSDRGNDRKGHAGRKRHGKARNPTEELGREARIVGARSCLQGMMPGATLRLGGQAEGFEICNLLRREHQMQEMEVTESMTPVGKKRGRKRSAMETALEVAKDSAKMKEAVESLKGDFWANTTRRARESRRTLVLQLALEVGGRGQRIFPLRQSVIEGVAAALKQAGMASGDQYLNELKLAHIEAGCDLTAWMVRSFTLCKRALVRMRGPVKKATEFRLESLDWDCLQTVNRVARGVKVGILGYAWAHVWMLREIEVSHVRWKDVETVTEGKLVKLFLPLSKTDQRGLGVRRTLKCCGTTPCIAGCAWHVWTWIVKHLKGKEDDFVFGDSMGRRMSKDAVIKAWQAVTDPTVTGHSGRRSGAMWYVRRGMTIEDLAFLGRWKSSVVISYAEDALQEVPANGRIGASEKPHVNPKMLCPKTPGTPLAIPGTPVEPAVQPSTPWLGSSKTRTLWAATATKMDQNKVWHRVTSAGWHRPISEWSTACGWHFADRSAKAALAVDLGVGAKKCQKCKSIYCNRDDVKEGTLVADLIGSEMDSAFVA